MYQKLITTSSNDQTASLFGPADKIVNRLSNEFSVHISNSNKGKDSESGDCIVISGEKENVDKCAYVMEYLKRVTVAGTPIEDQTVEYVLSMTEESQKEELTKLDGDVLFVTAKGKPIKPKTVGQKKYAEAIKRNTIVFGIGPAGTGKTFLAVAMAVEALRNKQVSRIILTRPAVEAGERLGFLPGDLQSKIDPYLRPLYDALFEMMGAENFTHHMEKGTIEIAPLAYMRGRTLDNSFIILDEAQNTTSEQMKMFLTRLGYSSKVVVTGDPSQTDLPEGKKSGLAIAASILKNIDDITIHEFTEKDVVRHHLVQKIIKAYDVYEKEHPQNTNVRYRRRY